VQRALYIESRDKCLSGIEALAANGDKQRSLLASLRQYVTIMEDVQASMTDDNRNAATARFQREAEPLSEEIRKAIQAWRSELEEANVEADRSLQIGQRRALVMLVLMNVVAAVFVCSALLLLRARIVGPIVMLTRSTNELARGDLRREFRSARRDEFGDLMNALDGVRVAWINAIDQVKATSSSIQDSALSVLNGSAALSQRTSLQTKGLRQSVASMAQIHQAVSKSAEFAARASDLAANTNRSVEQSSSLVRDSMARMSAIRSSSSKISEIVGIINGIAFQTNLLALNASVEAARAGALGRGFAVVAQEVRELANRSSRSAQDIKRLVDDGAADVNAGSALVTRVGSTMDDVQAQVSQLASLVSEIALAAGEQRLGIGVVNAAVSDLDLMTQANASLVDEAAGAATNLKGQVEVLDTVVSVFKLT
jgi:methyl-accepting chemotaxis protein